MKDSYTFKMETRITVTKEDVIQHLIDEGFFDVEGEDGDTYLDTAAVESYEPDYEDYENLAHEMWENDDCEYYGPDPV